MEEHDRIRSEYAETIRSLAGIRSERLVRALSVVPRERFVGLGPWRIVKPQEVAAGYQLTPDGDPRHIYQNVLVALDPARNLNNGEPAALALWLDQLALLPGENFLHVGCGVGYYTAIAAAMVAPGSVVGVELDALLAHRARQNLAPWPHVRILSGDGSASAEGSFDSIFINAGATEPVASWLNQLRAAGRLLVPLTADLPLPGFGAGYMLSVTRSASGFSARFITPVGILHCAGARSAAGSEALRRAFTRGGQESVQSLRREPHCEDEECWLHGASFCLSRRAVPS